MEYSDSQTPDAAFLHIFSFFDISDSGSNFVAYIIKTSYYVITFQSSLPLTNYPSLLKCITFSLDLLGCAQLLPVFNSSIGLLSLRYHIVQYHL